MVLKGSKSHGENTQARVRRVLQALLAEPKIQERKTSKSKPTTCRWPDKTAEKGGFVLSVDNCRVRNVQYRVNHDAYTSEVTTEQVKEAFGDLEALGFFLDRRGSKKQGSSLWHFDLQLPSRDPSRNLAEFDKAWAKTWRTEKTSANETATDSPRSPRTLRRSGETFFNVPLLPEQYVERSEVLTEIKQKLKTNVLTVIAGLGGLGKSVLASAIAHDTEVLEQYQDGVLWVTLGQTPNLQMLLGDWIRQLDNSQKAYRVTTPQEASEYLRELLEDKQMLLVIDDVWNSPDAEWFQVGGPHCHTLVTTRTAVLTSPEEQYRLKVMSADEALSLMRQQIGSKWAASMEIPACEFAELLGYLPLALKLMAAQIARGRTWDLLRKAICQETKRLRTLDAPGVKIANLSEDECRHYSVRASLGLSLKWIEPELLERFIWLGILPDDAVIQQEMAMTLWGLADWQTEETLLDLYDNCLLMSGVETWDGEKTYQIHDLLHEVAQELISHPEDIEAVTPHPSIISTLPGLGMALKQAQQSFLSRHRTLAEHQQWHRLPQDGYIHRHLIWHMEKAGWVDEIHTLLAMSNDQGRNAWFEACDRIGKISIFISDLYRAWRLAESGYICNSTRSIGLQCRYALMQTTLKSLVNDVPRELVISLVEHKIWTPAQALAWIQQRSHSTEIAALIPYLPEELFAEALDIINNISGDFNIQHAIKAIAPKLPQNLMSKAAVIARGITNDRNRLSALSALAKNSQDLVPEIIKSIRKCSSDKQSQLFDTVLDRNQIDPNPEQLQELYQIAISQKDESVITNNLIYLGDFMPKIWDKILKRLLKFHLSGLKVNLTRVSKNIPDFYLDKYIIYLRQLETPENRSLQFIMLKARKVELWPEIINDIVNMNESQKIISAIGRISTDIPQEYLPIMIRKISELPEKADYLECIRYLAIQEPKLWDTFINGIEELNDYSTQQQLIRQSIDYIPQEKIEQFWPILASVVSNNTMHWPSEISFWAVLAKRKPQALDTVFSWIENPRLLFSLQTFFINFKPQSLPYQFTQRAYIHTQFIRDTYSQKQLLFNTKRDFSQEECEYLISMAVKEKSYATCAEKSLILCFLANQLSEKLQDKALEAISEIYEYDNKIRVLQYFADYFSESKFQKMVGIARSIENPVFQSIALRVLARQEHPELILEAFHIAVKIESPRSRLEALANLADCMPIGDCTIDSFQNLILQDFSEVDNVFWLSPSIKRLAQHQTDINFQSKLISIANSLEDLWQRNSILCSLASVVDHKLFRQLFEISENFENESHQSSLLAALAKKATESELDYIQLKASSFSKLLHQVPVYINLVQRGRLDWNYLLNCISQLSQESEKSKYIGNVVRICPEEILPELELETVLETFHNQSSRAHALGHILSKLNMKDINYNSWCNYLHQLSYLNRSHFLDKFCYLEPAIQNLGGEEAWLEALEEVKNVCSQWP